MLTILWIAIAMVLLAIGGVFALLAKDNQRRGQSGGPHTASSAEKGRASGLD